MKSIIYYTDNRLADPIFSVAQRHIAQAGLPIVSVSLKPIAFGENHVVEGKSGYVTMMKQIITALEHSTSDYVFFCEHDVLYSKCHFDFTPPTDDIFYYNENVWRWEFGSDTAITHDRMLPLSSMACNRELALRFYRLRWEKIQEAGLDAFKTHEPELARLWGYEPGTKQKKRGGLTNDDFSVWSSPLPLIDIRHPQAFSPPKTSLASFKHIPTGWREIPADDIPGWNVKEMFVWI